ncbi:MAG TPA: GNAT family N-acetyltransferase [Actinoplanes sp.]|nr:GNAT family N-acetyltransferase [Actinoplanes sp.]
MTDVRLEPMSADQFGPWRAETEIHYAQSLQGTGKSAEAAAREAAESYDRLLPQGVATADNHVWYAYDGDRRVGFLWIKVTDGTAFVYNVAVEDDLQRQGYGRAIMLAGERWCRERALTRIGLHVFTGNTGARALYEQLGFVETGRNMAKRL